MRHVLGYLVDISVCVLFSSAYLIYCHIGLSNAIVLWLGLGLNLDKLSLILTDVMAMAAVDSS